MTERTVTKTTVTCDYCDSVITDREWVRALAMKQSNTLLSYFLRLPSKRYDFHKVCWSRMWAPKPVTD